MPSEFKSFYLKDLLQLIDRTAIDTMLPPNMPATPNSSGMWTEANAHIAAYNNGIRSLAIALRDVLAIEGDDDE